MTKEEELRDKASCFNRAGQGELMFVLLARDITAPATIRFWIKERLRLGKNKKSDDQILEARAIAARMEAESPQVHK